MFTLSKEAIATMTLKTAVRMSSQLITGLEAEDCSEVGPALLVLLEIDVGGGKTVPGDMDISP